MGKKAIWSDIYANRPFPLYWRKVFDLISLQDRQNSVLEIGCGQGDVLSIFCYLGFEHIISFERGYDMYVIAKNKISDLFGREDVLQNSSFPSSNIIACDILVMVNCVYYDDCCSKIDYLNRLRYCYEMAGCPSLFIYEAIDSSYVENNDVFPMFVRLGLEDIRSLFPCADIDYTYTYQLPANKTTKCLYIIRHKK